jgi:ABC-type phosphate/phosphonate transport system substrate-binding protein
MNCNNIFLAGFIKNKAVRLLAFLVPMLTWGSVQADLVLTSPPRESEAAGVKQYGPLADYLSELLGEKVTYEHPKGWLFYQRDMRADKYDIIFDGPHFMSWRMKKFNHTPVARLPGTLGFVVVTNSQNDEIENVHDLVNKKLCVIAPPNLSTITVLAELSEPARQPSLKCVKGGMKGVYRAFSEGQCQAAIFRDKFYMKKFSDEDRSKTKVVYKSVPVPNQGITVSERVSDENRQKIIAALTEVNESTKPILKRFSPKAEKMLPASNDDYEHHYKLLTGIIFGWEVDGNSLLSYNNEDQEQATVFLTSSSH